jgi:hypothetical protein
VADLETRPPYVRHSHLGIFLALAVLHTWPIASAPWRHSLNHNADAQLCAWTISWIAHTLPRHPAHVFDGNIFAPEPATLTYSEPMVPQALMAAPVLWLGASPVLAFNLVLITGLILTAWSGWFVVAKWTGSSSAGLVAGALAAFNVHLLTRLPHLQAAHAWTLPLTIYFADRLVDRITARDVVLLALVVGATATNSVYWLALAGLVVTAAITIAMLNGRWRHALAIAGTSCLGLALAGPVLLPYLRVAASGATRPIEVVAQFSATPAGYLTSTSHVHQAWSAMFFRDDVNVLFAGIVALTLAALGTFAVRPDNGHRRRVIMLLSLAAIGIVLSFGPSTPIYRWFYEWVLPLRGLRAAARFGFLYLIAVALLAGLGVAWLERRASMRLRIALVGVLLAAVTVEVWQSPVRTQPFDRVPSIYRLLTETSEPVMLVEVPFYPADAVFENGEYVLNATAHWKPVMNGTSGATPMSYRRRAESFWYFPRDWAIAAMKREGATHVMVHLERFGSEAPEVVASLADRRDLQLLGADAQGHRLYKFK